MTVTEQQILQPEEPRSRLWLLALTCLLLLGVELYAIFFDIGGGSLGESASSTPVIATYRRGTNEVRSRAAGTITWNVPAAGASLHRNDAVLTMTDAQALVEFSDGAAMTVEPDSLVVLSRSDAGGSQQRIVLHLLEGSLTKKTAGHLPVAIDLGDSKGGVKASIEDPTGTALFQLRREGDSVKLDVEKGNVEVEQDGKKQTVAPFQSASITARELKVIKETLRFSALAPDGGRVVAREKSGDRIVLSWEQLAPGGLEAKARVKSLVSRHADMADAEEADVDGTRAELKTDDDGAYFWQLVADDGGVKSRIARFSLVTKTPPEAEGPDDDDEVTVGTAARFHWKPPHAGKVLLETSTEERFTSPTRVPAGEGRAELEETYDRPQTIYWRLRADYGAEAGLSAPTETRKLVVKPRPLLKAPRGTRAKVKVDESRLDELPRWSAALSGVEKKRRVTVELEWEPVEGAAQYRIQISETEDFNKIILDRTIASPPYRYATEETPKARRLFFRIAGIDAFGTQGQFSDANDFDIEAAPRPKPKQAAEAKAAQESPILSADERSHRQRFQFQLMAGAAYHSRTFKSSTALPTTAQGSGIVPSFGALELHRWLGQAPEKRDQSADSGLGIGLSYLAEKAEPKSAGVTDEKLDVPVARAWVTYEFPLWGGWAGLGPYATTTTKFSYSGATANVTQQTVLGITGMLSSSPVEQRSWHWRVQLGAVGSGAKGGDGDLSLRHYLAGPVRAVDQGGIFFQGDAMIRYFDIETSYGAILEVGLAF